MPFVAWRSSVTHLRLRATWLELQERLSLLSRVMEENLGGIRVVRAFAAQAWELTKFDRASKNALELSHRRVGIRVLNTSAMSFSFFLAMGLVLWVGGSKVAAGEMTVGTLTSFLTFMTILQMPVRQLGLMVNSFSRASTCGSQLFGFLDLEVEIADRPGARPLAIGRGDAAVRERELRLRRHPAGGAAGGELRGEAGGDDRARRAAGERQVDDRAPDPAVLRRDRRADHPRRAGHPRRDAKSLRQAVAVVQQDGFLFTTTLENNIAYADPWASDPRIEGASGTAQLHGYVLGVPMGYRTVVGERGVSLSGGQRQRLAIARALMTKPAVMVFDDSTAAINAGTEQRIRKALRSHGRDRVTIIIAHRLGSLMHADRILFLEEGEVVESGTHTELLALGGRYRALFDLQLTPAEAPA